MTAPRISVLMMTMAPNPFLEELTAFAIKMHRIQAADKGYELIVIETRSDRFAPDGPWLGLQVDKYIRFPEPIGGVKEANAGIDAASGDFILFTGTDIIPPPGWDAELLRLFDRKDCGAASLSAFEPNATIGPAGPVDLVVEGMFSPFTMFRRGERYDEAYQRVYQDSDLIMRLYERGLRAFRSCRKHVWHLGSVTNNSAGSAHAAMHAKALAHDERLFYQRWGKSPLAMFAMMRGGAQVYGREHEALLAHINLHYDPNAQEEPADYHDNVASPETGSHAMACGG